MIANLAPTVLISVAVQALLSTADCYCCETSFQPSQAKRGWTET